MERNWGAIGKKTLALVTAITILTVLAPIQVRAEVSDYWAEKDVDVRLEPHYENIIYTLDPIETVQRFDAKGEWYWPVTTDMNDSQLVSVRPPVSVLAEQAAAGASRHRSPRRISCLRGSRRRSMGTSFHPPRP